MKSKPIPMKRQLQEWILATLRQSAWAPLSVFGFYLVALALGLYDLYPPLDIPTHLMGGIAITYFYRSALVHSQKIIGETPLPIQVLLAFTGTGTTAILWEFYESLLDRYFGTITVYGLGDTLKDMFFGLLGAFIFSLFYRRRP